MEIEEDPIEKVKREALIEKVQIVASDFSSVQRLAKEHKSKLDDINKKAGAAKNIGRYKTFDEVGHSLTTSQIATINPKAVYSALTL